MQVDVNAINKSTFKIICGDISYVVGKVLAISTNCGGW